MNLQNRSTGEFFESAFFSEFTPSLNTHDIRPQVHYNYDDAPDALVSPRLLSDESQGTAISYTYYPYGESSATVTDSDASANRYRFTGREYETAYMTFYRSRYYNNRTARFYKKDRYPWTDMRPLSLNNYLYVEGNPTNFNDPRGFSLGSNDIMQYNCGCCKEPCTSSETGCCAIPNCTCGGGWPDIGGLTSWFDPVSHIFSSLNFAGAVLGGLWDLTENCLNEGDCAPSHSISISFKDGDLVIISNNWFQNTFGISGAAGTHTIFINDDPGDWTGTLSWSEAKLYCHEWFHIHGTPGWNTHGMLSFSDYIIESFQELTTPYIHGSNDYEETAYEWDDHCANYYSCKCDNCPTPQNCTQHKFPWEDNISASDLPYWSWPGGNPVMQWTCDH